jgi:hypothetical protein
MDAYNSGNIPEAIEAWSKTLEIYKTIKCTERNHVDCYKNIGGAKIELSHKVGDGETRK